MGSLLQDYWYRASEFPGHTWEWVNTLSREEWMVVLITVCVSGFVALLGFTSRRI